MKELRIGIIGVGNMGSRYAVMLQNGEISGAVLSAVTRVREANRQRLSSALEAGVPEYQDADALWEAVESGELILDAVIIATPHYDHEKQAVRAFLLGLNVLCEKPAGVYSAQSRRMMDAAGENVYGMVFHMRSMPIYQRLKEIVEGGKYGTLKRLSWTVTDWYRPDPYFAASKWHSTWETDGGGVVLNQCPHNLDLLCWLFGAPERVQGFCHEGRFHNIPVEDDVTAYFEWKNGATGTFVSSTGDAPGLNRLEISLEEAMIICEDGKLDIYELEPELGMREAEYRKTSEEFFRKIHGCRRTEEFHAAGDLYQMLLQNFADCCRIGTPLLAPGAEGHSSLLLANGIYLSSWEHRMVMLPSPGSDAELEFERAFECGLLKKGGHL